MSPIRRTMLTLTGSVLTLGLASGLAAPAQAADERPARQQQTQSSTPAPALINGPLIEGPLIEGGLLSLFFGNYMDNRGR